MRDLKTARSSLTDGLTLYCMFAVIYLLLIFVLPASPQTMQMYNLSSENYRVLLFISSLPSLFVWFTAFLSVALLKSYASAISSTKEGPHFDKLADGTAWLAFSLPITA